MPAGTSMPMPIPMPKGMPMIPGLVGLAPPRRRRSCPGAGVDPATLPLAKPTQVAAPRGRRHAASSRPCSCAATIRGHTFVMYGFNGQVPGPLIRVPQNATIVGALSQPHRPAEHGALARRAARQSLRRRAGRDAGCGRAGGRLHLHVHFPDAGIYWYHPHVREDIEQAMGLFGNMLVDSPDPRLLLAGRTASRRCARRPADQRRHADSVRQGGARLRARWGASATCCWSTASRDYSLRVHRGEVVRFFLTNVVELAHLEPLVRRRADEGGGVGREPVRARGAGAERGASRRPSATWSRCGSTSRGATRWSTRSRRSTITPASSTPEVDTLGVGDGRRHAGGARLRRAVRHVARRTPRCRATSTAYRRVLRQAARQDAHADGRRPTRCRWRRCSS